MSSATLRTVRLTPAQHRFRHSSALFRAFVGGRGAGKSFVGAYDLFCRARSGGLYLVTAPTYPMLRDATLRGFLQVSDLLGRPVRIRKGEMSAALPGGSEVLFRTTSDPDRLRGPNYAGAWMDEASISPPDAQDIIVASLRQGGRQGWLSCTFTPKGLAHWTYDRFAAAVRPDTELIRSRTDENPFLPPDFAATIARQYDDLFAAQELGGEFVDTEGAEWPASYFGPGVWFTEYPDDCGLSVLALDPSRGKGEGGDYAAYVLVRVDRAGTLWCEAVLLKGGSLFDIVARGVLLIQQERPNRVVCETNIGQELLLAEFAAQLRSKNLQAVVEGVENWTNKEVRIRATLGKYLARGRVRFRRTPGTELLVRQLQTFPNGDFDDGPDSLELAVRRIELLCGGK